MAGQRAPHDVRRLGQLTGIEADTGRADVDNAYGATRQLNVSAGNTNANLAAAALSLSALSDEVTGARSEPATGPYLATVYANLKARLDAMLTRLAGVTGNQSANQVFGGPTSGGAAAPGFRALVVADLPASVAGSQGANTVFAGPATGAAAAPTFRTLTAADLPASPLFSGTVALAKLTTGGANGSLTLVNGMVTAYTAPT